MYIYIQIVIICECIQIFAMKFAEYVSCILLYNIVNLAKKFTVIPQTADRIFPRGLLFWRAL